jgi:hypothetical protein
MKKLLVPFCLVSLSGLAWSQAVALPQGERYEPKAKSAFNVPTGTRAPFIPIGWVKKQSDGPAAPVQEELDPSIYKVTSILLGSPSLAVINGRSYEEGQFLRVPKGSTVRPRVFRILDGQVIIQIDTQMMTIPLSRPELGERKIEEELLNEEKDDFEPAPAKPVARPPAPAPKRTAPKLR